MGEKDGEGCLVDEWDHLSFSVGNVQIVSYVRMVLGAVRDFFKPFKESLKQYPHINPREVKRLVWGQGLQKWTPAQWSPCAALASDPLRSPGLECVRTIHRAGVLPALVTSREDAGLGKMNQKTIPRYSEKKKIGFEGIAQS